VLIWEIFFSLFVIEMVNVYSLTAPMIARKEAARMAREASEKQKTRQVTRGVDTGGGRGGIPDSPIIHFTPNKAGYFLPLDVFHFRETNEVAKATRFVSMPWTMAFPTKAASVLCY
jgi:hypothetical protein